MSEPLGQQILDKWGTSDAPECGEVRNEVWWKTLHPQLLGIIEKHKNYAEKIYVLLNLRNEALAGPNVKHFTYLVANEEFPPKASAMCIAYDYKKERDSLVWVLPDEDSIDEILAIPETYDKKLVADCRNYRAAEKVQVPLEMTRKEA